MKANKIVAGIQFTENGVLIEKAYGHDNEGITRGIAEEKFTGELLEIAKRVAQYRMAHCFKQLHANLANAKVITPESIIWKGGHFEVGVWEALADILKLDDVRKLNRLQCQQLVRSMMFQATGYWLYKHDSNWNQLNDSESIRLTDEFKMFVTEHFLCAEDPRIE
jgi:hypothetical protein